MRNATCPYFMTKFHHEVLNSIVKYTIEEKTIYRIKLTTSRNVHINWSQRVLSIYLVVCVYVVYNVYKGKYSFGITVSESHPLFRIMTILVLNTNLSEIFIPNSYWKLNQL